MSSPWKIGCGALAAGAAFGALTAPANAATLREVPLSWPWALPFIGLLMSIALGPLLAPRFWKAHYGKIAFTSGALTMAPLAALYGVPTMLSALAHAILGEYLSFIVLLTALYVVAGGILVTGRLEGTPLANTAILAFGTAIASIVGTTGAAMILIRPLLQANSARLHNAHVVVFFIILVANIGGALSPLGDPPLFVGFLQGVHFLWPAAHLWRQTTVTVALVLAAFVVIDVWYYRQDCRGIIANENPAQGPIRVRGLVNLMLIVLIVGAMMLSALWKSDISFDVYGTTLELQDVIRDAALVIIAAASLLLTPEEHRQRNGFTWEPIIEVAKLFAGIFVCIIPVIAMLHGGENGPLSWVFRLMTDDAGAPRNLAYFWLAGTLSAVLDNAPTYLVFFELAGGDAGRLMDELAPTLAAISMGAVYMGALTYIGNPPNLMIYVLATERGVEMPTFFRHMVWSGAVLLPVFVLVTYLFI